MAKIHVTDWSGATHEIAGHPGDTLMETIKAAGINDLAAICGGCCSCATCHVYVDESWQDALPAQEDDEHELVADTEAYRPNSRLSCQIELTESLDGLAVTIAPEE